MSSRQEGRSLPFRTCDVFTTRSLSGNQLAVFEDAGALTDGEMQALAREMNLSETTFIVRRDLALERAEGVRVRIFTTAEELPFAGHPTLGTAATIRRYFPEHSESQAITLDLNVGKVTVQFGEVDTSALAIYGEMTQPDPVFGALHERGAVARALGLELARSGYAVADSNSVDGVGILHRAACVYGCVERLAEFAERVCRLSRKDGRKILLLHRRGRCG